MKVSAELRDAFRGRGEVRSLAKKTPVLEQGDVSRHAYFVESGCLRLWLNDDGASVSLKFFLPGELCASLDSLYHQRPSRYGIDAIQPSVVRVCEKRHLQDFMDQSPAFREYINSVMVHCMADYQNLFADRVTRKPEDRYRALIEQDPEVLDTVPLHYVASYLGVTPVSLSRIRRKLGHT